MMSFFRYFLEIRLFCSFSLKLKFERPGLVYKKNYDPSANEDTLTIPKNVGWPIMSMNAVLFGVEGNKFSFHYRNILFRAVLKASNLALTDGNKKFCAGLSLHKVSDVRFSNTNYFSMAFFSEEALSDPILCVAFLVHAKIQTIFRGQG